MTRSIELVWFGGVEPPEEWPGAVHRMVDPAVHGLAGMLEQHLPYSDAEAWLFWDGLLGVPQPRSLLDLLQTSPDLWHGGLRLGTGGQPGMLDFVRPVWMFTCDPPSEIEATSWRLSFRACLVRTEVLRQMPFERSSFSTLDGAALDWGHRLITRGVRTRHVPSMVPNGREPHVRVTLPLEDEVRFVYSRFGKRWLGWSLWRAAASGYAPLGALQRSARRVFRESPPSKPSAFQRTDAVSPEVGPQRDVTVLVPTLERYDYLRRVLEQLQVQTVPPLEVIVVDQSPLRTRQQTLEQDFPGLSLRLVRLDAPGQCSSRNAGLKMARGEFILFLDDDDEIEPDLIERHLRNLQASGADVSSGIAHEVGSGELPDAFTLSRLSDVFPTNNSMIRRSVLERSGLFDLAYDRGKRADGDIGMRMYLSGAMMVLEPSISVIHHHAPRGGLRAHRERVITYASSRQTLLHRHLPSASEIYLAKRYFSDRQCREMMWMRLFGTLAGQGGRGRRLMKALVGLIVMPHSLWRIARANRDATDLLSRFPEIPSSARNVPGRRQTPASSPETLL